MLPNIGDQNCGSQKPNPTPNTAHASYTILNPAHALDQKMNEVSAWKIGPCEVIGKPSA